MLTNILINSTSFSDSGFKEAIDLGLVCAAFDQQVKLIFTGRGVFNLVKNQRAELLGDKNHVDILKGIEFYDIKELYADAESIARFRLSLEDMIANIRAITPAEIVSLNCQSDRIVAL